ncbi:hypothetical protein [Roseovarius nanhaiticus]|uniref:Uncharacterized protein n=1 Tax=Roseovarius nanhaiticus TaxID=573024 RepID=A0A1N7HED5_9RHOB|nr:hypothetical protein [Roseovarius nanhaiticus]SEK99654.1 hypothetical protein SAMN05216208_2461 [Roseovarius nanhaiticus]SIS23237.1 hypothetical protein SAMN05421666_2854 [Roseovarius nanhaiticus]
MPRWMFFGPLIALVAAVAVIGLSMGRKSALRSDETAVITRVAMRYVREAGPGASETDCTARLATAEALWLVVSCTPDGRTGRIYYVDRFGAVAYVGEAG